MRLRSVRRTSSRSESRYSAPVCGRVTLRLPICSGGVAVALPRLLSATIPPECSIIELMSVFRTYRDDTCVVVEIGDNGPGIPPEVKPHIFEPFFTTKGVGQGTGLGLDTVQRIVKKHRGNIEVSSKPGDTRFQVWLPLAGSPT